MPSFGPGDSSLSSEPATVPVSNRLTSRQEDFREKDITLLRNCFSGLVRMRGESGALRPGEKGLRGKEGVEKQKAKI